MFLHTMTPLRRILIILGLVAVPAVAYAADATRSCCPDGPCCPGPCCDD
jgi:hypothetical protein